MLFSLLLAACAPAGGGARQECCSAGLGRPSRRGRGRTYGAGVKRWGSGAIVLDMWDGIGASDGEMLTQMLNKCVEENPDITVKRQIMAGTSTLTNWRPPSSPAVAGRTCLSCGTRSCRSMP